MKNRLQHYLSYLGLLIAFIVSGFSGSGEVFGAMVSATEGEKDRGTVSEHVVNGDANYLEDFVTVLGSTPTKPAADLDPKTAARIAKGTELSDGFISVFKNDWGIPSPQLTQLKSDLASAGDDLINFFVDKGKDGLKAWEGLFNTSLRIDIPWLTRASKWLDEGAEFAADGTGKLTKNGEDILQIKNDKILPDKFDFDPSTQKPKPGGTAIGEPSNGYQVYKHGDDLSVRRVPSEAGISPSNISTLNGGGKCHCLHRHGADVTDDALKKRATEGRAPDGSARTRNNDAETYIPPKSSKFNSPEKVN